MIISDSILPQILSKQEALYEEILGVFYRIEQKSTSIGHESGDRNDLHNHIIELDHLIKERVDSHVSLQVHYTVTLMSYEHKTTVMIYF